MKKYQQLLLAILSLFSFLCLLIYRHEYNKLRYVLEVLNFFGTPGTPALISQCIDIDADNTVARGPFPAWQTISNHLHIYSAFWENSNKTNYVKAFGAGILNEKIHCKCYLWYNKYPKTKIGTFSYSKLLVFDKDATSDHNSKNYILYCEPPSSLAYTTPVGVTFYQENFTETNFSFIPVFNVKSSFPPRNSTGICVMPTRLPELNKSLYIDFINFHKVIGVNDFVVYGGVDHHTLLSLIKNDRYDNAKVTVFPWNYPPFVGRSASVKSVAENDCITRLKGLYENVIILEWNKFVVPRYLLTISQLINEINQEKAFDKFLIPTLVFCTEYKDEPSSNATSLPVMFKKTRGFRPKIDSYAPLYNPHLRKGITKKFGKNVLAVHHYTDCGKLKLNLDAKKNAFIDETMLKFKNVYFKSQLPVL